MNNTFFPESVMRALIGADHLNNRLRSVSGQTAYPLHNIEQISDNGYVLSLALAGYSPDDINVSVQHGTLTIESSKKPASDNAVYLHRGISFRHFSRSFILGEHVQVMSATMENGLLNIALERIVPEEAKPKRIPISTVSPQIEQAAKVTKLSAVA